MLKFSCKSAHCVLTAMASTALLTTGCVDHDYDLSKDIDKTVTIGGNSLYLPACSTGELTMGNILDLDNESSIRAITQRDIDNGMSYGLDLGDYVLIESGTPSETYVKVEQVHLNDIQVKSDGIDVPFVPAGSLTLDANFISNLEIVDNNVDTSLKSLSSARTDLEILFNISFSSATFKGGLRIDEGYTIKFDNMWTVEIADPATASFAQMVSANELRFTTAKEFVNGAPFNLKVKVTEFRLGDKKGEGLYEPGKFNLQSVVEFSGTVTALNNTSEFVLGNVHLNSQITIDDATLLSVTGVVDPEVTINATNVEIGDIPDFLDDPSNNLDIANPQIYFTVTNTSPVSVTVNALLRGIYDDASKAPVEIYIGKYNNPAIQGTEEIVVRPGVTRICLSRTGQGFNPEGSTARLVNVKVEKLADLLASIPNDIQVSNVNTQVVQEEVTFILAGPMDPGYQFNTAYEAVVPLAFGQNLNIVYEDTDDNWDTDLKGYSFGALNIEMDVVNSIPLSLTPDLELIGEGGADFTSVTVDVDGGITAGTVASPTTSHVKFTVRCNDGSDLNGVKGIRYKFTASNEASTHGMRLNEKQGLRFDNIKLYLTGGVTVNLDEIDSDD